jgi:hypothetical protein
MAANWSVSWRVHEPCGCCDYDRSEHVLTLSQAIAIADAHDGAEIEINMNADEARELLAAMRVGELTKLREIERAVRAWGKARAAFKSIDWWDEQRQFVWARIHAAMDRVLEIADELARGGGS